MKKQFLVLLYLTTTFCAGAMEIRDQRGVPVVQLDPWVEIESKVDCKVLRDGNAFIATCSKARGDCIALYPGGRTSDDDRDKTTLIQFGYVSRSGDGVSHLASVVGKCCATSVVEEQRRAIVVCCSGEVILWNLETDDELSRFNLESRFRGADRIVRFNLVIISPSGQKVAFSCQMASQGQALVCVCDLSQEGYARVGYGEPICFDLSEEFVLVKYPSERLSVVNINSRKLARNTGKWALNIGCEDGCRLVGTPCRVFAGSSPRLNRAYFANVAPQGLKAFSQTLLCEFSVCGAKPVSFGVPAFGTQEYHSSDAADSVSSRPEPLPCAYRYPRPLRKQRTVEAFLDRSVKEQFGAGTPLCLRRVLSPIIFMFRGKRIRARRKGSVPGCYSGSKDEYVLSDAEWRQAKAQMRDFQRVEGDSA